MLPKPDYSQWRNATRTKFVGGDAESLRNFHIVCALVDSVFQMELELVANPLIRSWVESCLFYSPAAYWERPSAFYKGHHPDDELGQWGNVLHVKRTIKVARTLSDSENLSAQDASFLVAALLIHDIGKYGFDGGSPKILKEHPSLVRDMIKLYPLPAVDGGDDDAVLSLVETHMGRWGQHPPETLLQRLCHYSDCLASNPDFVVPVSLSPALRAIK